jgi:hypothetical protein
MPRPTNKKELLSLAEVNLNKLLAFIEELPDDLKTYTNDEQLTKKKYAWTGTTSLGAYLISATSSHYEWGG